MGAFALLSVRTFALMPMNFALYLGHFPEGPKRLRPIHISLYVQLRRLLMQIPFFGIIQLGNRKMSAKRQGNKSDSCDAV